MSSNPFNPEEVGMTDTRKAYEEKFEAQLKEWGARIDLLSAKADKAKAETKIEYYKTIDTLQGKHDAAGSKLKELRGASDEAWRDLRTGAENVWSEVKTSFNSAALRFK
jgi:hypothetical protein